MRKTLAILIVGLCLFGSLLIGCGGSTTKVETASSQTMGQELLDLKKAYDEGVITEREYERAKKDIMRKYK